MNDDDSAAAFKEVFEGMRAARGTLAAIIGPARMDQTDAHIRDLFALAGLDITPDTSSAAVLGLAMALTTAKTLVVTR